MIVRRAVIALEKGGEEEGRAPERTVTYEVTYAVTVAVVVGVHAPEERIVGEMMLVYPLAEQYESRILVAVDWSWKSEHAEIAWSARLTTPAPRVSARHRHALVVHPTYCWIAAYPSPPPFRQY